MIPEGRLRLGGTAATRHFTTVRVRSRHLQVGIDMITVLGILLVTILATGLTVGLLVRTLVQRDSEQPTEIAKLSAQVALLQDEVESLSHKVKEIEVAQDFDRKLLGHEKQE
jgi:hypothetical protein